MADPVLPDPQPTALWLYRHDHQWEWLGAHRVRQYGGKRDLGKMPGDFTGPFGPWHPTFRCTVCKDIIEDLSQVVGPEPVEEEAS